MRLGPPPDAIQRWACLHLSQQKLALQARRFLGKFRKRVIPQAISARSRRLAGCPR
jgi:hypothetical protein